MKRWYGSIIVILILGVTALIGLLQIAQPSAIAGRDAVTADFDIVLSQGPTAYGTNTWWTDQDAELWASRWAELGPSVVRLGAVHGAIEPINDNDDPNLTDQDNFLLNTPIPISNTTRTFTYQNLFETIRNQSDLSVIIHFPYLAPWLSDNPPLQGLPLNLAPYPPNNLDEYREFIETLLRYLIETLNFPPERIILEAMNEPDLGCGVDPVVACFWDNWTLDDIAAVVQVTYEAIQSVDPNVTLIGLGECCGTDVVRTLLDHYPAGDYLQGLSYHYYAPSGFSLNVALNRSSALAPYNLPIYLDEYGSRQYLSEGTNGALWHSQALKTLWEAGIAPIQHPISEWPLAGEPYTSMGLFDDWRGDWALRPSYWVYTNFFRDLNRSEVISYTAPAGLNVLAARRVLTDEIQAVFWVTNLGDSTFTNQPFVLHNFPQETTVLHSYDNLVSPNPIYTTRITGAPLIFTDTLPAHSSRTFVLRVKDPDDALDHIDLTPDSAMHIAGRVITYTLTAYDAYDNDWDVTNLGAYIIDSEASGVWTDNVYHSEITGTWTVTGTYNDRSDNGRLVIWAPQHYVHLPLVLREATEP